MSYLSRLVFGYNTNSDKSHQPDQAKRVERDRSGYGGRHVTQHHDYTEPELEDVLILMKGRRVFIDIGANTGIYTLRVARYLADNGIVIAFEPNPEIASDLFNSIQINRLSNVRLRICCVSNKIEPVVVALNRQPLPELEASPSRRRASSLSTFSMPLDQILMMERLPAFDYLKLNARLDERLILEGGRKSIKRFKPLIQCMDVHRLELPFLDGYSAYRMAGSRNRLMLHKEDSRTETVIGLGYERVL